MMTALSADRPSTDPNDDLFGHAPFAKTLADSICRYPGSEGLVLALYGPWGSGKSTILSYVRHYLDQRPEQEQPVVVTFNPWWFSGQEHLARTFLGQLQAVLPEKSPKLEKLRELLRDYGKGIGGFIDLSGMTGGVGAAVGSLFSKPKDITALKDAIVEALVAAQQKILVVIDDIDRLTPDEVRQLFTVIKALADFPNVIYLLAFDREVAVEAIKQQTGLPGERYLEKIIQVPFEIPPVDRESMRAAFFKRLEDVLQGTPEGMFDPSYWSSVFYGGVDPLIEVPRDIVRFTNTLSITYPSVVGEVNPVDFIAVEALRVFLPDVYDVVRSNPDRFSGYRRSSSYENSESKAEDAFHEGWQQKVPEDRRPAVMRLVSSLFPRLESGYGSDWMSEWRKSQRVCVPEWFPTYFRLSIPPGVIRRSEMLALLALGGDPISLGQALEEATQEMRPDGLSKARALLERLMDYVEEGIPDENVPNFIKALLDVGDRLVVPSDKKGVMDFGNESRVRRLVYHLLKRIAAGKRLSVLSDAFTQGVSIGVQVDVLFAFEKETSEQSRDQTEALLDRASLEDLKTLSSSKIMAARVSLLHNPLFQEILWAWQLWGDATVLREWCSEITASDQGLLTFLGHFLRHVERTDGRGFRRLPRVSAKQIGEFLDADAVEQRLRALVASGEVPDAAQEAVSAFLRAREQMQKGRDPDGLFAFDDE